MKEYFKQYGAKKRFFICVVIYYVVSTLLKNNYPLSPLPGVNENLLRKWEIIYLKINVNSLTSMIVEPTF
jgi:hypothetical protein